MFILEGILQKGAKFKLTIPFQHVYFSFESNHKEDQIQNTIAASFIDYEINGINYRKTATNLAYKHKTYDLT